MGSGGAGATQRSALGYVAMRSVFRHPSPRAALALVPATLLLLGLGGARWGEQGHKMAAQAAVQTLPAEMPGFFRAAGDQLVWLNPDPDRWRGAEESRQDPALNGASAPDHYIDLEWTTPGSLKAPNRVAFLDSLRAAGQKELPGFLPFRIVELTQRLRIQFRQWRQMPEGAERRYLEQRIINDAGILGHYVTDGSNPHHTTIHHNGWVGPNPDGFATDNRMHSRFEGTYVRARITQGDITPLVPRTPTVHAALRDGVMAYLMRTNAELRTLYTLDKQEPFGEATSGTAHKDFTATRIAAGAAMLRDLWWTAWITSVPSDTPPRR